MRIDFTQPIRDINGDVVTEWGFHVNKLQQIQEDLIKSLGQEIGVKAMNIIAEYVGKNAITLKTIAVSELARIDDKLTPTDKLFRGQLALKIHNEEVVDLQISDVALIKQLIELRHGPIVVMRTTEILDPHPAQVSKKEV